MPNDTVDGGVPAPEPGGPIPAGPPTAQAAPPAPAPAADKPKPAGWRATLSNLSSLIKDFGIVAAIVATPIAIVVVLIWEGVLRPRLTSEIMTELSRPDDGYRAWHRDNVIGALSGYDQITARKWLEAEGGPVIERLARPPEAEEIKALFADPEFKTFFLEQVLLALLKDPDKVKAIMKDYAGQDLIEAWLHKEIANLSNTVEKQVDEVHVRRLYFKPNNEDPERPFSNTRDRFYASKTQLYSIAVEINAFDHFNDDIFQKNRNLFVQLGTSDPIIVSNGGMTPTDVTCQVYKLLTSESGFVSVGSGVVEADGRTFAPMPRDGFDITVIVAAKKGRRTGLC